MFSLLLAIIYLAFISLGLPDSLLGAAWPVMHLELGVPVSYAGIVSMIISGGHDCVQPAFRPPSPGDSGRGLITAVSVLMTAAGPAGLLLAPAPSRLLCLWAMPYGLGAGSRGRRAEQLRGAALCLAAT